MSVNIRDGMLSGIIVSVICILLKHSATPFIILNIYYLMRNDDSTVPLRLELSISYGVIILIMLGLFSFGNTIYDDIVYFDFNRFMNSLSDFSSQMRFDLILTNNDYCLLLIGLSLSAT